MLNTPLYSPPSAEPQWNPHKLREHFNKRVWRNRGCIEKILGIPAGSLTEAQYDEYSRKIPYMPFMAWTAMSESEPGNEDYGPCEFVVDRDLGMDILSDDRTTILTCYHKHVDKACLKYSSTKQEPGQIKRKLNRYIRHQENMKRYKTEAVVYYVA